MVDILKNGLKWTFIHSPPLRRTPWNAQLHLTPSKLAIYQEVIQSLLNKGAIEEVHNHNSLGYYSILFLRAKPSGEWRPIIDLKDLNKLILNNTFRMESARSIQQAMTQGLWACSIDLTDAYYHVPINEHFRKYLRFAIAGKVYQFVALPFGLVIAPRIFTDVMLEVARVLRTCGVQVHMYLDDWLFKHQDPEALSLQITATLSLLQQLGLIVNLKKSDLTPNQVVEFVGVLYNLQEGRAYPPPKRVEKIKTHIQDFLLNSQKTAGNWVSLLGLLGSVTDQVPLGRLHTRPLQFHLKAHWSLCSQTKLTPVPVTQEMKEHLQWWINTTALEVGVPLQQFTAEATIFTDASTEGWGAHCNGEEIAGKWDLQHNKHSNLLEMKATIQALKFFGPRLQNKQILIATDNTTVLAYINHQGGTKSSSLMEETTSLFEVARKHQIILRARHIPGRLNVLADKLSRENQVLPTEWSLHQETANWIFKELWEPHVDLFATRENHKLPCYVSPIPDESALQVDALSMNWDNMLVYAYPPTGLIQKVIQKLKTHQCRMILIAPHWPTKPWFPELLALKDRPPLQLPLNQHLLKQPGKLVFHQNLQVLNLHAWSLSHGL